MDAGDAEGELICSLDCFVSHSLHFDLAGGAGDLVGGVFRFVMIISTSPSWLLGISIASSAEILSLFIGRLGGECWTMEALDCEASRARGCVLLDPAAFDARRARRGGGTF